MFNNVEFLKEKIASAITIYNSNVAEDKIQMSDSAVNLSHLPPSASEVGASRRVL